MNKVPNTFPLTLHYKTREFHDFSHKTSILVFNFIPFRIFISNFQGFVAFWNNWDGCKPSDPFLFSVRVSFIAATLLWLFIVATCGSLNSPTPILSSTKSGQSGDAPTAVILTFQPLRSLLPMFVSSFSC